MNNGFGLSNTGRVMVYYTRQQVLAFLRAKMPHVDWSLIEAELPPIVWRSRWEKLAAQHGLPYTRRYLQNLDCLGCGPSAYL